jgi:hypothetical protein
MNEEDKIKEAFETWTKSQGWKPEDPVLKHWQARPVAFEAFVAGWKARERQA